MKLSDVVHKPARLLVANNPSVAKKLKKSIKTVETTFPEIEPVMMERDPAKIARAALERVQANDWREYIVSDLAAVIRAAFQKELRDRSDLAPLRDFLLRELAVSPHAALLKAALDIQVATYSEGNAHSIALTKALKPREGDLPMRSRRFLKVLPEVLDAMGGASALGNRMVDAATVHAVFEGLPAIPSGGLIDEASAAFVASLAPRMADPSIARRILDWFAPKDGTAREVGAHLAIDALMSPWRKAEPPAKWKQTLLDSLVAAFGDPRLTKGGAWAAADKGAIETFISWQTGATLDAFLDIVSETIKPEDSHMWADRRPFWEKLHEEGRIEAAWVAFSPAAARIAKTRAERSGIGALRHFGRQVAGGSRSDTSLLIMRINNTTVVEGSHSYKVHVFPKNRKRIPKLFESRYDCEDIRLSLPDTRDFKRSHHGQEWKTFVREKTGCLH